jgi:hypothetical protein
MKTKTILAYYAIAVTVGTLILFWVNKSFVLLCIGVVTALAIATYIFELRKTIAELKNSLALEEMNTRCSEYLLNRAEKRLAQTIYRCNACNLFIGKGIERLLREKVLCEKCYQKERNT